MNSQTLYRTSQYILVIGAILAMIVMTLSGLGKDDDLVDLILIYFIGAGFVVIGLACVPFLMISAEHFVCALKDLALPIGLIMSCYAFIVYMGDIAQSNYIVAILPAVAGGMISLMLADAVVPKTIVPLAGFKFFLIWLWVFSICKAAHLVLGGDPIWVFWHTDTWFLCWLVISLFYLYNPKQTSVIQRISTGAIAAIILAVSLSTVGVGLASQGTNMDSYGKSMVLGVIGTIYGCWIYITSLLIGRLRFHYDVDSNRSNWHLAEIFTFFIILNMGPKTVFEVWGDYKSVQTEETALEASSNKDEPGDDS